MQPFEADTFIERKTGRIRRRYIDAYNQIDKNGFDLERDSKISAFVKLERYYEEGKSPRMIMGRDPKFNIAYAQIIEPIEKAFFELEQVANACDYVECGAKFSRMVAEHGDHFVENDMSKYEASQRRILLRLEFEIYCRLNPGLQNLVLKLFAAKCLKIGTTTVALKFWFLYCRGSGDLDTSLGNGIINYITTQYNMIKNYCPNCEFENCSQLGCRTFAFVVKGDDSYMSRPTGLLFKNYYINFGLEAKIVLRDSPEQVEFCSGHFVEVRPGVHVYVQKLQKLIESLTTVINEDVVKNGWAKHYYRSLGMMYNVLYGDMPVYRDIAAFLLESTKSTMGVNLNLIDSYNLKAAFSAKHDAKRPVFDESLSRLSVSLVNNMDYAELTRIENWFRTNRLSFSPSLSKRCNMKSRTSGIVPVVDFDRINTQILTHNNGRKLRTIEEQLLSFTMCDEPKEWLEA